mmetsp:Transcript_46765/g.109079  ORF Transcript_46765/g.109079 Transcript_46765/m.109079 type:complete len:384 (-) Transcript_46765:18-1169(-)
MRAGRSADDRQCGTYPTWKSMPAQPFAQPIGGASCAAQKWQEAAKRVGQARHGSQQPERCNVISGSGRSPSQAQQPPTAAMSTRPGLGRMPSASSGQDGFGQRPRQGGADAGSGHLSCASRAPQFCSDQGLQKERPQAAMAERSARGVAASPFETVAMRSASHGGTSAGGATQQVADKGGVGATRPLLATQEAPKRPALSDAARAPDGGGTLATSSSSSRPSEEVGYLKKTNEYLRQVKHERDKQVKFLEAKVESLVSLKNMYQELYEQSQRAEADRSKSSPALEISNLHDQLSAMIQLKEFMEKENLELRQKLEGSHRHTGDEHRSAIGMSVCVVCMDNLANLVCMPCKHLALCTYCGQRSALSECPICRATVMEKMQIYTP